MYVYEVYWTKANNRPAGVFTSEKKAKKAIEWLKGVTSSGEFFIRTRQLDVVNGRYAFMILGITDQNSDTIDDIRIF